MNQYSAVATDSLRAASRPPINPEEFRQSMRWLTGGVTIIATEHEGQRAGLTATAVCSVCAEPASLLVCINESGEAHDKIVNSGRLSVNVLTAEQQALAMRFAGAGGIKGEDKFSDGNWTELLTGSPVLSDCLVSFDCEINETVKRGTHTIFICSVAATRGGDASSALAYLNGSFKEV